ncbi:nucleoside deaminase [Candidatus Woesearchaeota archaeon]|nr:nucleoside deaminase [Candidatus Woesearchaeota archaeon]
MKHPNKKFMLEAIELAKKHKAVGCVIVKDNKILARGWTTVYEEQQPFRHGEINAIEKACKKLKSFYLTDCWVYTTYEPCPMCASAIVWAKAKAIVYGAAMDDENELYTQRIKVKCKDILKKGTPKVMLKGPFMRKECKKLMDEHYWKTKKSP